MAELINAPSPAFAVRYATGDLTAAIDPFLVSLTFTDHLTGKADEVEVTLENREGVFTQQYFPNRGDELSVSIGWTGGDLAGLWECGGFQIDEAQVQGPPDQLVIRALSSPVKAPVRTPRSRAFEGATLKQVAQKVADGCGMQIAGEIPDLTFNRITQREETDLAFLHRLAQANGCILKVTPGEIVFHQLAKLLSVESVAYISRSDLIRYNIRSKTAETFRAAQTRYWDPTKRDQVKHLAKKVTLPVTKTVPILGGDPLKVPPRTILGDLHTPKVDIERLFDRVENAAQAQARQDAALLVSAMGNTVGTLEIIGDPRLRAGMSVFLWPDEWGDLLSGWYTINFARHSLSRQGGYTTELDISRNPVSRPAPKRAKAGAPPPKLGKSH